MRPSTSYRGATLQSVLYVVVSSPFSSSTVQVSANSGYSTLMIDGKEVFVPSQNSATVGFLHGTIKIDGVNIVITALNGIAVFLIP